MAGSPYSLENDTFSAFLLYGCIVLVKMMAVVLLTTVKRIGSKTFLSSEDVAGISSDPEVRKRALVPNENVERVRRCHLNDMENVYLFVLMSLLYIGTNPAYETALLLFRIFTVSRILHTIVYVNAVPQPARGLCFMAGFGVCGYMAFSILRSLLQ